MARSPVLKDRPRQLTDFAVAAAAVKAAPAPDCLPRADRNREQVAGRARDAQVPLIQDDAQIPAGNPTENCLAFRAADDPLGKVRPNEAADEARAQERHDARRRHVPPPCHENERKQVGQVTERITIRRECHTPLYACFERVASEIEKGAKSARNQVDLPYTDSKRGENVSMATSDEPMQQTTQDKILEQYRRQKFWEDMDTAYAVIQDDPEALAADKAEFALWETTLMDGLAPDKGELLHGLPGLEIQVFCH